MIDIARIAAAQVAAHAPDFLDGLSDAERAVLPYCYDVWLRPGQIIPSYDWRYYGFICGRGWGKSLAIAAEFNRRVEHGESRHLGLMAPNEDRIDEVQASFLVALSPPWFKAERYRGGVRWPNGVIAVAFTPNAPGAPRSENLDLSWLCEIVDWSPTTRAEAFDNITTATRVGRAQVIWDTTSKGKNDVILRLLDLNDSDPRAYPIQRGTMFDNPMLTPEYMRTEYAKYSGRRREEELFGKVFAESAGALWQQAWIDAHRVAIEPPNPELRLVSIDPAISTRAENDETGIVTGSRVRGHAYIADDLSGRHPPEDWGDITVSQCVDHGCAGAIVERNRGGDQAVYVVRSRAKERGHVVRMVERGKPFPRRTPGVIYVRDVTAIGSKETRAAGPATETEAGRVHLVGRFDQLETEWTTYEPGQSQSPNRYDASVHLLIDLLELNDAKGARPTVDAAVAKAAHASLRDRLRQVGRGRRVG